MVEFEDYERLGGLLKEAEEIMHTHERSPKKKAPLNRHFREALGHIGEAKNSLEEMMFIEHPGRATARIFYGERE